MKPVHPSHSRPAPASTSSMLLGGNRSLSYADLGPTQYTAVRPAIPEERWMCLRCRITRIIDLAGRVILYGIKDEVRHNTCRTRETELERRRC